MTRFIAACSILLLAGAGCSSASKDTVKTETPSEQTPSIAVGEGERASSGTITSINLDSVAADGPAVIVIKTPTGTDTINVPSFGLNLCEAKADIADVYTLKVGDSVEVKGDVEEGGALVPCRSSEHYLRVTGAKKPAATTEGQRQQAPTNQMPVPQGIMVGEGERASSGTITSINLDSVAADGPAVIVIKTPTGTDTINVPSFGLNLCAASKNIADVYTLKVGDKVEVNGKIGAEGELVPCASTAHYLRVAK